MTQSEKDRLANYKTMATFNRDQVADFFNLLAQETIEQAEATLPEPALPQVPTVKVVEKPKKSKKIKKN